MLGSSTPIRAEHDEVLARRLDAVQTLREIVRLAPAWRKSGCAHSSRRASVPLWRSTLRFSLITRKAGSTAG